MNYNTNNNKLKPKNNTVIYESFPENNVDPAMFCGKEFNVKLILKNHWNDFVDYANKINFFIRSAVLTNVNKLLKCRTEDLGVALIRCKQCGFIGLIYATCKSRLCSSCGNKYNKHRATSIASVITKHKHRHCVFTIPKELRIYFYNNYELIDLLFQAVADTIKDYAYNRNKGENYTPGFICVLHTYGRDLKFNPHIHLLLNDFFLSTNGRFIKNNYFNYESFRKNFKVKLCKYLCDAINTKEFTNLSHELRKKYTNGFYVYMPENPFMKHVNSAKRLKDAINYVVRYLGKPCIADSRIIDYDEQDKTVSFIFQDHKDDNWYKATMHVYQFISRLIAHVPDDNFKMVRYYGFYAFNNKLRKKFKNKFNHLFSRNHIERLKNYIYKYEYMLMHYFDRWGVRDCPICESYMEFVYMKYHPDKNCRSYVFHHPSFINTLDL